MASPVTQAGALPEATEYAPLTMAEYITGLWTQRSALRDAAVPYLYSKFYSAGRYDSLIDGLNLELSARLTVVRRAGASVYNSQTWPAVQRTYSFKPFINGAEDVHLMVDTAGAVYDGTAKTVATSRKVNIWNKSDGAGSTYFQQVGNTLYFANGVDNKKWILSQAIWNPETAYSASGVFADFIIDSNSNIQQAVGSFTVDVQSVAIAAGVLTCTLDPTDPNLPENLNFLVGTRLTFEGMTAAAFLNGQTVTIASVQPNGLGQNVFTATYAHADYPEAVDDGTVTSGTGLTGGAQPVWNTTLQGYTYDGGAQWINRGNYVQNWGIVAPAAAPTVSQAKLAQAYPLWQASTYYSTCYLIQDEAGHIQLVTTFGTTGVTEPTWNDSGGTTMDGSVVWKDQGSGAYTPGMTVTAGQYIFQTASDGNVYFYQAVNGGTASATPPVFTPVLGLVTNDNGVEWENVGIQQFWANVTASSLSNNFIVIPVMGGGNIVIGVGNDANGTTIALPTGYTTANLLTWTTAGPGLSPSHTRGIAASTAPGGVLNATLQNDDGSQFNVSSNWACAAWSSTATMSIATASGYTYLSFTTLQGADLCIVLGQASLASGSAIPAPAGFSVGQFAGIAGMATVAPTGHVMQSIWCQLDGSLNCTSYYRDNSLNEWAGLSNVFGVFYKADQGVTSTSVTGGTAVIIPTVGLSQVCLIQAVVNSGSSFSLPAGFGGVATTCSANSQQDNSAGDNDSHGLGACGCVGTAYTGYMQDGEGHQWPAIGNIFGIAALQNTTPVSPNQTINDANGDLQTIAVSGLSGTVHPGWAMTRGTLTVDNLATWSNSGTFSAASTGAWMWGYAYRNLVDGSVGTMSTASTAITLNAGYYAIVAGVYSTDPQAGSVVIYRTEQNGSLFFKDDEIPNLPGGGSWTYDDTNRDADLNILIQAATAHQNDPPPAGMTALQYHEGRVWGAVGNKLYNSDGPDVGADGNGNTAWSPVYVNVLPETITRMEAVTLSNGALLCVTTSQWWGVFGNGTASNPFFVSSYYKSCGLLSYDAMDVVGSTFHLMSNKGKMVSLDPSAGYVETGFPIGDQFQAVTTGWGPDVQQSEALYSPGGTYVSWYENGSGDTGLFVADGAVGWFRYSPVTSPESGFLWSPRAAVVGGTSAVQKAEVAPGVERLLICPAESGPILFRDTSTNADNGANFAAPYATLGSMMLAQPGEVAEVDFVSLIAAQTGTAPVAGVLFDEIHATEDTVFDMLEWTSVEPPNLKESETLFMQRFSCLQDGETPKCLHMQLLVQFAEENAASELLLHAVYGTKRSEKRQQP